MTHHLMTLSVNVIVYYAHDVV